LLALIPAIAAADSVTPEVAITSPEEGFTVASETVPVEVSYAAAGEAAVKQVDLVVDGLIVDTRVIAPPEASGTAAFTWIARKYDAGEHRLTARAYDSAGESAEAEIVVLLRRTLPDLSGAVRILSPNPGDRVAGKTTIQVAAERPSAVRYVIFLVDDVFKAMSNVRPYQYMWDTTRYLNGLHRLRVKAYLAGDREAMTPEVEVRVDNPSGRTVMRAAKPRPAAPVAPERARAAAAEAHGERHHGAAGPGRGRVRGRGPRHSAVHQLYWGAHPAQQAHRGRSRTGPDANRSGRPSRGDGDSDQ
jgi:hypothetical protein